METPFRGKYDSKRRFVSYWYQVHESLSLQPNSILEIGIGNGFVSHYLRRQGIHVTTLDIDEKLKPDHVGSVTKLPFPDNRFDVIIACEILEHLPYKESVRGLKEIFRVSTRYAVISLPDSTRSAYIEFPIPKWRKIKILMSIPRLFPKKHALTKSGHHWEIGKKNFSLRRLSHDIEKIGFKIQRTFRVPENPYHRFFILEKV